jgi:hypothetical protein
MTHAVRQRAGFARRNTQPNDAVHAVDAAQSAAKLPGPESERSAAVQTAQGLDAGKPKPVSKDTFKTELRKAIVAATTPAPKTKDDADAMRKEGGAKASSSLKGNLVTERDAAAGPIRTAATTDVTAESQKPKDPYVDIKAPEAGAAPASVPAGPAVPAPLPPERLDYSSDRAPTEQLMAQNNVTPTQLSKGNDPAFGPTIEARSTAEKNEAQAAATYRKDEAKIGGNALAHAELAVAHGLGGMHSGRATHLGKVGAQQHSTKSQDAAKRQEITEKITSIKNSTKAAVEGILANMDLVAPILFGAGLQRAEQAYDDAFEEAKGGVGTWLTTWGSDWDDHITESLATARAKYFSVVDEAIDTVAAFVDAKLAEAKARVSAGRKQVDDYVATLDKHVAKFGIEAKTAVLADFDAMGADIDSHRDALINKLTEQYKTSNEKMNAREEELREANKSLWQRVYDATVGLIKKILAFKDMLLSVLAKAAGVIADIISDPIGFLGNLIDGVMLGLKNFMSNIGTHLQKGLMDWLFGALSGAGLTLPDSFDLKGIVSIVLQVLGLTYANFRARAVKIVGEPVVAALEQAAEVFKIFLSEGVAGLWRFIKDKVADLKSMVLDAIFSFIKEKVIIAGVTWIIGLLNPASAFFKACKAIYDIVMFFINRGSQIIELVNAVVDSIAAIVKGNISGAAKMVEGALAKAIPVAIGFLASLLGLGDPSKPVRDTIEKAQSPVNAAIDWVIHGAVKLVKGAAGAVKGLFGKKEQPQQTEHGEDPVKTAKVKAGLDELDLEDASRVKEGALSLDSAKEIASKVKAKHPVFKSISVVEGRETWDYRYVASLPKDHTGAKKQGALTLDVREVIVRKKPSSAAGWRDFERDSREVARREILPQEIGSEVKFAPAGMTKSKKSRAKLSEVSLTPEDIAASMPVQGQSAQAFHKSLLPPEGQKGSSVGSSKPDFLVLTHDEIIPVEITLRSTWSKENVSSTERGARLHKHSQSASLMLNLQPFLKKNPGVKVQLMFISDQAPDAQAIQALEALANEAYVGQISAIKWLIPMGKK